MTLDLSEEARCPPNLYTRLVGETLEALVVLPDGVLPVTGDELLRHRIAQLEDWRVESAATVRSTERDVDLLKLESGTVKGLLVELRTEVRERDEHARNSLARLHQRLDEITTAESFEQGREAGTRAASGKTWKVVGWTVMAVIASMGVVVATLSLILH